MLVNMPRLVETFIDPPRLVRVSLHISRTHHSLPSDDIIRGLVLKVLYSFWGSGSSSSQVANIIYCTLTMHDVDISPDNFNVQVISIFLAMSTSKLIERESGEYTSSRHPFSHTALHVHPKQFITSTLWFSGLKCVCISTSANPPTRQVYPQDHP